MISDIIFYIFIINYIYLIIVLLRQSFSLYWGYCLELLIAVFLCIFFQVYELINAWTISISCILGVVLLFVPAILSRRIAKLFFIHTPHKVIHLARLRLWITQAKIYRIELDVFKRIARLMDLNPENLDQAYINEKFQIPYHYQPLFALQIAAHLFKNDHWNKGIEIFERDLDWDMVSDKPYFLSLLADAYRKQGNLLLCTKVLHIIKELEDPKISKIRKKNKTSYNIDKGFTPATTVLMAFILLFYIATEFCGGSTSTSTQIRFGANAYQFVIQQHEYWRLFSSIFLHHGMMHLIFNLLGLYILGSFVETYYGKLRFLIVFLASGILASLASLLWQTHMGEALLSVGASGAICGLLGIGTFFTMFKAREISSPIRSHFSFTFVFFVITIFAEAFLIPYIDNTAHFVGFGTGAILGIFLKSKVYQNPSFRFQTIALYLFSFVILIVTIYSLAMMTINIYQGVYPASSLKFTEYKIHNSEGFICFLKVPFTWELGREAKSNKFEMGKYRDIEIQNRFIAFKDPYAYEEQGNTRYLFIIKIYKKRGIDTDEEIKAIMEREQKAQGNSSLNSVSTEYYRLIYKYHTYLAQEEKAKSEENSSEGIYCLSCGTSTENWIYYVQCHCSDNYTRRYPDIFKVIIENLKFEEET